MSNDGHIKFPPMRRAGVKTCLEMVIATAIYRVSTIHKACAKYITRIISHSQAMANRYYCPHFTEEQVEAHRC